MREVDSALVCMFFFMDVKTCTVCFFGGFHSEMDNYEFQMCFLGVLILQVKVYQNIFLLTGAVDA